MDSLINHYTANKKVRNDDAYSPGGRIGLRPDRATLPYCQRAREAFPGVPVIAGGVEASLRRLAHYDYWSDTVRRSILLDCQGRPARLRHGREDDRRNRPPPGGRADGASDLRDLRGVAYALGARESTDSRSPRLADLATARDAAGERRQSCCPSFEEVKADKMRLRRGDAAHPRQHQPATTPRRWCSITIARRWSSIRRRCRLSQAEMDRIYDLPYTRRPHPSYTRADPRLRDDQGLGDDHARLLRRLHLLLDHGPPGPDHPVAVAGIGAAAKSARWPPIPEFKGVVSDIGGPTANMYQMRCTRPEVEAKCKRLSCVHPTICKLLGTDHGPLIELLQQGPHRAGHPQGAGRQRHPHGPGPAFARNTCRNWRPITSAAI